MRNTVLANLLAEWNRQSGPPDDDGEDVCDATQSDIKKMLM